LDVTLISGKIVPLFQRSILHVEAIYSITLLTFITRLHIVIFQKTVNLIFSTVRTLNFFFIDVSVQ